MRIKNNQAILNAPFGSILLTFADGDLIKCELSEAAVEEDLGSFVGHKAVKALQSYLKGDIHVLDSWKPSEDGTEFRRRVWKEIAKVRAGDTVTYGHRRFSRQLSSRSRFCLRRQSASDFCRLPSCCREEQFGRIRTFRRECLNKMLAAQARTAKHVRSLNE